MGSLWVRHLTSSQNRKISEGKLWSWRVEVVVQACPRCLSAKHPANNSPSSHVCLSFWNTERRQRYIQSVTEMLTWDKKLVSCHKAKEKMSIHNRTVEEILHYRKSVEGSCQNKKRYHIKYREKWDVYEDKRWNVILRQVSGSSLMSQQDTRRKVM